MLSGAKGLLDVNHSKKSHYFIDEWVKCMVKISSSEYLIQNRTKSVVQIFNIKQRCISKVIGYGDISSIKRLSSSFFLAKEKKVLVLINKDEQYAITTLLETEGGVYQDCLQVYQNPQNMTILTVQMYTNARDQKEKNRVVRISIDLS